MVRRGSFIVAGLVFLLAAPAFAQKSTPPTRAADEQRALFNQMAEAQKWAGEQLWHVKEAIDALPGQINELKDANAARDEDLQKMRDEVKGLYVETSSLRQQLEELKADIGGVNANVSGFRTFSGFFIAVMILLLAVIFVMTIRR
jgi:septal ring factor EnvC (AmiA/AmiB activator)